MPKIIKNIENKILKAAQDLFVEQGYEKADIRQIAGKANIAVGTLYNYYNNKEDLFCAVFQNHWRETLDKLDCLPSEIDPELRLQSILELLQQQMLGRKQNTWKHVFQTYFSQNGIDGMLLNIMQYAKQMFEELNSQLEEIIQDINIKYTGVKMPKKFSNRLAATILMTLFPLTNKMPNEKAITTAYLLKLVKSMCIQETKSNE